MMMMILLIILTTELVLLKAKPIYVLEKFLDRPFLASRQAGSTNKESRFDLIAPPMFGLIALHTGFNSPLPAIKDE